MLLPFLHPQGGFYDDNKGMDYHVPVVGGTGTVPTLRVVHVAAEMAPIAKVGCNLAGCDATVQYRAACCACRCGDGPHCQGGLMLNCCIRMPRLNFAVHAPVLHTYVKVAAVLGCL